MTSPFQVWPVAGLSLLYGAYLVKVHIALRTSSRSTKLSQNVNMILSTIGASFVFAVGLALSGLKNSFEKRQAQALIVSQGMARPTKVHGFLALNEHWDPSLAFVLGAGLAVNLICWPIVTKWRAPIVCKEVSDY